MDIEASAPKPSLQARLDAVFGNLSSLSNTNCQGWQLKFQPDAFRGGRSVDDAEDEDSDEDQEEKQVMAQRLIDGDDADVNQDSEMGDDGGQQESCDLQTSAAFRRQFEQEEEEDVYDRIADEGWHGSSRRGNNRPDGNMEVLDDNAFDRMCKERRPDLYQEPVENGNDDDGCGNPTEPKTSEGARVSWQAAAAAGDVVQQPGHDVGSTAMAVDDMMGCDHEGSIPHEDQATQAVQGAQSGNTGSDQGTAVRKSVFSRIEYPSQPNVAAPPPGSSSKDGTKPQQQHKRVRFSDNGTGAGSDEQPQPQDRNGNNNRSNPPRSQKPWRCGGRGGGVVLNWQRPGFVPDHVKHPERYVRYDLGETLTVGGGEQGSFQAGPAASSSSSLPGEAALMRAAVAAAQETAEKFGGETHQQPEAQRLELAVGAGAVKFTSKGRRNAAASGQGARQQGKSALVVFNEQDEQGQEQDNAANIPSTDIRTVQTRVQHVGNEDHDDASMEVETTAGHQQQQQGPQRFASKQGGGRASRRQFRTHKASGDDDVVE